MKAGVIALVVGAWVGCLRPAEERTRSEAQVGIDQAAGVAFVVDEGLAQIIDIGDGAVRLWAQAPVLTIRAQVDTNATRQWTIEVANCLRDAELTATLDGDVLAVGVGSSPRPTVRRWSLALPDPPAGQLVLSIAPPDAADSSPWRFAAMGDIQTGLDQVHEVFARINAEPDVRFVVSMGDLVEDGEESEYDLLLTQLDSLEVPYYSTLGNHELKGDIERWRRRFGRFNLHWRFREVVFSMVDSGNASLALQVYDWLDIWLDEARDDIHVFLTHIPPIDPIGTRAGAFRSYNEALNLLGKLARGNVDLTLYGHIHSYYEYSNAGIPAYISGGGGASPERLDGIGRHFLVVDADPGDGTTEVSVVRVD